MSSFLLLNIPECVARCILSDWLQLADVGHLDSAYCSNEARPEFSTLLSTYRVFIDHSKLNSLEEYPILFWSVKRAVKVDGFTVSSKLLADDKLQDALFEDSGPSIRWIAFGGYVGEEKEKQIFSSIVTKAVQFCPNTEVLFINQSYDRHHSSQCEECYPQLTQAFRRLHTLHFDYSDISSHGLVNILQHCITLKTLHKMLLISPLPVEVALPSLEQFSAQYCNVPEAVLFAIAANCPRMKHMDIFNNRPGVSNEAVQAILQGCPLLQYTDVEYATDLSHELRVELARRRNFTKLTFAFQYWKDATNILSEGILRVSPNLIELSLLCCPWLTDDVLAVCAQHCKSLKSLHLYDCNAITVTGILAITAPGNKLQKLVLTACTEFCDVAVLVVAQRCPHLNEFYSPPQVSSVAIVALAKGCPLLEVVDLWSTRADDAALAALCLHFPQLRSLHVEDCPGITLQAINELMEHHPSLTIEI